MTKAAMDQGFWPESSVPEWVPELLLPSASLPEDATAAELLDAFEACVMQGRRLEALAARFAARAFVVDGAEQASGNSHRADAFIAEVATITRQARGTASRYLGTALELTERSTATLEAFESGRIGWRHAQVIAEALDGLAREQASELERQALITARTGTVPRLRDRVRRLRDALDPDGMAERRDQAMRKRPGARITPRQDGLLVIELTFDAVDGVAVKNRLRAQAKELKQHEGETRTLGELENDIARDLLLANLSALEPDEQVFDDQESARTAFGDSDGDGEEACADLFDSLHDDDEVAAGEDRLATRAATRLGTRRIRDRIGVVPVVSITVPLEDAVAGLPGATKPPGPGWLEGYGWIDPGLAQRMLAHSPSFSRVLMSKQRQVVLDVGPKRLPITKDLKRWLQVRDGTCRFPGCNRTARVCEIDHTKEVRHGGRTAEWNLGHLCAGDHDLKDEGWRVWQDVGSVLHWLSPYGRVHTTRPAQLMATADAGLETSYSTDPKDRAEARRRYLSDWKRFHGLDDPHADAEDCPF